MSEKIFGEIQSTQELNELAVNLRKGKEFDEIRLLCSENNISEDVAEEFIQGNRLHLAEPDLEEDEAPSMTAKMDKVASEDEDEGPITPMGKVIEAIEREAFEKAANEDVKEEDLIPMGTTSLADIVTGNIPKPTLEELEEAKNAAISDEGCSDGEVKAPDVDYTIEDVRKKLEAELKIYRDGDSKYVVEKLVEKCETDKELLNAIMLPHKSYDKAFQYFFQKSRTVGYKMPRGNMVYLDNDSAVMLSIEYFKRDDAAEEKKKKQAKQDAKTPAAPRKATATKEKGNPKRQIPDKAKAAAPEKPKKESKPKQKNEMDGQMSLFDF